MTTHDNPTQRTWNYPLFEAIRQRRSRRFPLGAQMEGLVSFQSSGPAVPLDPLEEALLVTVATGISGATLPDDLFGGNHDYTLGFGGRTYSSACASHGTHLFMTNDDGVFLVRPTPLRGPSEDSPDGLIHQYQDSLIRLSDSRLDLPVSAPTTLVSNSWNLNQSGTTLLMPVTDVTAEYLNIVLMMLDSPNGIYIYDDLNGNAEPLKGYLREGMLDRTRSLSLSALEQDVLQCTASTEQALMLQNVFLATQALGLGGWLLSPSDPYVVLGGTTQTRGLGFRFVMPERSGPVKSPDFAANQAIPVGLDGLVEALCPPYTPSMTDAVLAIYEAKWGENGSYARAKAFASGSVLPENVGRTSGWALEAAIELCSYIWDVYGRFPARIAPMQMSTWFQAHHLETAYYDRFHPPGAYHETIRDHMSRWHVQDGLTAPS